MSQRDRSGVLPSNTRYNVEYSGGNGDEWTQRRAFVCIGPHGFSVGTSTVGLNHDMLTFADLDAALEAAFSFVLGRPCAWPQPPSAETPAPQAEPQPVSHLSAEKAADLGAFVRGWEARAMVAEKRLAGIWSLYDVWSASELRGERAAADKLLRHLGHRAAPQDAQPQPAPDVEALRSKLMVVREAVEDLAAQARLAFIHASGAKRMRDWFNNEVRHEERIALGKVDAALASLPKEPR